jgi:hypothetical protein
MILLLAASGSTNELPPPKGWTLWSKPQMLVYDSINPQTNKGVRIEMKDSEAPEGELQAYLERNLRSMGYPEEATRNCRPRSRRGGKEVSCSTTSPEGAHTFYAIRTNDGQYRFVHALAVPTLSVMLPQLMNTKRILDAAENNQGRSGTNATVRAATEPPQTASDPRGTPPQPPGRQGGTAGSGWGDSPAPATDRNSTTANPSPEGGSLPFQLEAIYLHLKYTTGVGGGVYPEYKPYLYFRNGLVTTDLAVYPRSTAEFEAWRKRRPQAWGRWTRNGDTIRIEWPPSSRGPRKPEELKDWHTARQGSSGMQLQGAYQSLGGGGSTTMGGDVMVAAWRNLEFLPGGKVRTGGGSSMSSGGGGTGVSTTSSSRRKEQILDYHIEGNRIDFVDSSGQRRSEWFFLFPNSDDVIGVANSVYQTRRKRR